MVFISGLSLSSKTAVTSLSLEVSACQHLLLRANRTHLSPLGLLFYSCVHLPAGRGHRDSAVCGSSVASTCCELFWNQSLSVLWDRSALDPSIAQRKLGWLTQCDWDLLLFTLTMTVHTCTASIREIGIGGSRVQGQPGLYEILFQNKTRTG